MVSIKRVYDPPGSEDGRRVLVDRLWPRGISREKAQVDEWIKELAPSDALRRWFAHDPARWEEFRTRYREELAAQSPLLDRFCRDARKEKTTLLYAARDQERNNAQVLKELIDHGSP